jgi:hypothetical protein
MNECPMSTVCMSTVCTVRVHSSLGGGGHKLQEPIQRSGVAVSLIGRTIHSMPFPRVRHQGGRDRTILDGRVGEGGVGEGGRQ